MSLDTVTVVVPFYRNCQMLTRQVQEWEQYPAGIHIIVVDDGSPEEAESIIRSCASQRLLARISLYRILIDIPWNREEARNLGTDRCETEWLIHIDIDHVLPASSAASLLEFSPDPKHWYRFPRWRKGKADETRKKDVLSPDADFGQIKPHIDSYLIRKDLYLKVGGYDLAFSGCLGGGTEFLRRLESVSGSPVLLPEAIALHVYTRSEFADASDWSLSRDREEGKRRARNSSVTRTRENTVKSMWQRLI